MDEEVFLINGLKGGMRRGFENKIQAEKSQKKMLIFV